MKTLLLTALLSIIVTATCQAAFRLPSGVYEIGKVDEAIEKSRSRGLPITFMISNTDTECGLTTAASEEILKELRTVTVIVYCQRTADLPETARQTVQGVDRGKHIPYAFVMTPEMDHIMGTIKYEDVRNNSRKTFQEIKKSIKDRTRG